MTFSPPSTGSKRIAVRLTPDAERQVRGGHPWVFDRSIASLSHSGEPGDLAVIFDKKRDFLAIGLFDPASPIRLRILHVGSPTTVDGNFWRDRVLVALSARQTLLDAPGTTAFRALNGENDGFPGLVADVYDQVLVIKVYSTAWLPHLRVVAEALYDALGLDAVLVRHSRMLSEQQLFGLTDGYSLIGTVPAGPVMFLENGLLFEADLERGQKTGYFLDQRDNRAMVQGLASGARVLDVFCCTGGFSVHAAAGGARSVTSVDSAKPALDGARRNMIHNVEGGEIEGCRHDVVHGDAFAVMESMISRGERYDMVVIDPPSFASKRANVGRALRSYQRLTGLGLGLLHDGGNLVQSSCSSRISTEDFVAVVRGAAAEQGVSLDNAVVTGHAIDHPVTFAEGAYLKAIFATPGFGRL